MQALADSHAVGTGYALVLAGLMVLTAYFALQTLHLRRQLRKRDEQRRRLQAAAYTDPLTQLPNRRVFEDRLSHALEMAERRGTATAVLYIDVDDFKQINERHGRSFGDAILAEFASRCRDRLRSGDTIARWGDDAFTVLIEDLHDTSDIEQIAERLRDATTKPFIIKEQKAQITVSIGVALGCNAAESPGELVRTADAATYRAKRTRPPRGFELISGQTCIGRMNLAQTPPPDDKPAGDFIQNAI